MATTYDNDTSQEIPSPDPSTFQALIKAEIDQQIATAHAFPRKLKDFMEEAKSLVTLDQDMADACIYSLPRKDEYGNKVNITGPSARFAEIVQNCYGNNRGGGRVIGEEGNFIVAQGVFHDLQKNVMVTMEVRRRITGRNGKKFSADMIGVTGNAAASIAHRNAVLKGVSKALWAPLYDAARRVAIGEGKPMAERWDRASRQFTNIGVDKAQLLAALGITSAVELKDEHLETMTGWRTAIREGTLRVEELFSDEPEDAPRGAPAGAKGMASVGEALARTRKAAAGAEESLSPPEREPEDAAVKPTPEPAGDAPAAVQANGGVDPQPAAGEIVRWIQNADSVAKLNAVWETWGGDGLAHYLPDDANLVVDAYESRRNELEA